MTLLATIRAAKKESMKHRTSLVVVKDEITNAEEDGPYSFCLLAQAKLMFPHGKAVACVTRGYVARV